MISSIGGLPGKGKNVLATHIAISSYKKYNNIIARIIRKIKHQDTWINNIYSSYPILLNKRKKIYSNSVSLYDLDGSYKFLPDAVIIIDEVQSFYDSDEFKDFPKSIAVFNQFHRHFGIKDIYYISQHPSRIVKKLRNLMSQFIKIRSFYKIPFFNIGVMYYSVYYEFDDYGKWHHPKKEAKTYDVKNVLCTFHLKPVFKSYDSKYLKVLNSSVPLYRKGQFNSLNLSEDQIYEIYGNMWEYNTKHKG